MSAVSRRVFLRTTAAVSATALAASRGAWANPLGLPLGLQLYSVRDQLKQNYEGTLKQVAGFGYREVEAAGFFDHAPEQVNAAMQAAGLHCVSAHYSSSQLQQHFDAILEFHKKLGTAKYIICAFPGFPDAAKSSLPFKQQVTSFTLADWQWNAEQFDRWGAKVKAAGFQFGYHNHTMEFKAPAGESGGSVPYDLLVKQTDPKLVIFELDCGWVTVGGGSPEHYLRTYADRIKMLHVKDFKKGAGQGSVDNPPPAAELGQGTADYPAIFKAVKPGAIQHMFVEQEAYPDLPWEQALTVDARYMEKLKA